MIKADFIIIGAGIAGTSAAYHFADHGKAIVLEKESQPGYHSTGRSAAIYGAHHSPETINKLTRASYDFLNTSFLSDRGLILIGDNQGNSQAGLESLSTEKCLKKIPFLKHRQGECYSYDASAKEIDVAGLHQAYIKNIKKRGSEIHTDIVITSITKKDGLWHICTKDHTYETPILINAAGGWADEVATLAGIKTIGLIPKRRTVITVDLPEGHEKNHTPMVVYLDEKLYFKTETGSLIISPMDETPVAPHDVQPEEIDIATAAYYLEERTTLTVKSIKTKWAGMRSFVSDGIPVVDRAPEDSNFIWLAGQGGYGIKTCDAMARCAVEIALNDDLPDDCKELGLTRAEIAANRNL